MLDQLDLVHMNGRVYDPFVARFLSADPIIQDPLNGQNYSRYTYVFNNPTNLTDPTGFCAEGDGTGSRVCAAQLEKADKAIDKARYEYNKLSDAGQASVRASQPKFFDSNGNFKTNAKIISEWNQKTPSPSANTTEPAFVARNPDNRKDFGFDVPHHLELLGEHFLEKKAETGNFLYENLAQWTFGLNDNLETVVGIAGTLKGVKSGDVMTYKDFTKRSVVGDKIEGHEVWQFSNMRVNGLADKRLGSDASKNNPVVALSKETHQQVNAAQRSIDASNQTPSQNIQANANVLRQTKAVPESVISRIEKWALEHAKKLGF
jgi:RHS repeat-associated protein